MALRLDSWREQRLAEELAEQARREDATREAALRAADREALEVAKRAEWEAELADKLLNSSLTL